ncbi:hypothetical protein NP590_03990 [Methylomonas sp. SURF-2]|uniref:Uncharacterized protein n=1 Tax=Methylomonas subterranea TaxID=2952225 RepID=A0ABT1TCS2_9GAMM|nr:hypothetical protein [Methylomonas sp. SURF-2]MCQ8103258.1 hypothetical protein [Methylomonas sp. SURF-2]
MQTDIDKTKIYQRTIEDLEARLTSHGGLIEDQVLEIDELRGQRNGACVVAGVAIACLLVVFWQYAAAPVLSVAGLECSL